MSYIDKSKMADTTINEKEEKRLQPINPTQNCSVYDKLIDMEKKYDSILDEAKEITGGDRMQAYGHPRENFSDIALMWNAYGKMMGYFPKDVYSAKDVAMMMVLFKQCREKNHKRDNLVDMAGYVRNMAQIEGIQ